MLDVPLDGIASVSVPAKSGGRVAELALSRVPGVLMRMSQEEEEEEPGG